MIQTPQELRGELKDTAAATCRIRALDTPRAGAQAFFLDGPRSDPFDVWKICRDRLEDTGRWPVVVDGHGLDDPVQFTRADPRELIERAETADVDAALEARANRALAYQSLDEAIAEAVLGLKTEHQNEVEAELARLRSSGELETYGQLQRWMLAWEVGNLPDGLKAPSDDHLEWTDWGNGLLLLPTPRSWEVMSYLEFWGSPPEVVTGLVRRWAEQYGAELVAHFGTILQFAVTRPPSTLQQALRLAWDQETVAECTTITRGVSLLDHARVLVGRTQWLLHERP